MSVLSDRYDQVQSSPHVLVIGAGVSGLTTALCLRGAGMRTTIVAEEFAPRVTSVVAGALWEWPPAVCGHHQDQLSLMRSKIWSKQAYDVFLELAENPETGVYIRPVTFYFRRPIEEEPRQSHKMNELKDHVRGFEHSSELIIRNQVNPASGVCDAYSHLSPQIDTDTYLIWLQREVKRAGCTIEQRRITGRMREQEKRLLDEFRADAIVNCSGLGSAELAGDAMYPLRGALVRILNNGQRFPRLTEAHCVSLEGNAIESGFIFIVPRGQDLVVLGGIAEPDQWDLNIGLHNYEPIRQLYQRCREFLPMLQNAELDPREPVRVGLRPVRRQNVRLEQEAGTRIIHNYGHGGSGVTLSWGCAREVVERVRELLK